MIAVGIVVLNSQKCRQKDIKFTFVNQKKEERERDLCQKKEGITSKVRIDVSMQTITLQKSFS